MRHQCVFFLLIGLFAISSCKGQTESAKVQVKIIEQTWFNSDSLLHHVAVLSSDVYQGRRTGTEGAVQAKMYIINQFKNLNIKPLNKNYNQYFSFDERNHTYQASNVLGWIKGTESPNDYIVLSAHYDHEGIKKNKIYNGADDDASGISALFAFAEYLNENPPNHSVIFAAVDAEELGLVGSKYFVDNSIVPIRDIRLNINMDMISRSDKSELFVIGSRYYKTLEPAIKSFKSSENMTLLIGHDGSDGKQNWTNSSDHASFHKAHIPFLYFGVEDHKDYHQPTDDFENIHPNFYQNAVVAIITVFRALDNMEL